MTGMTLRSAIHPFTRLLAVTILAMASTGLHAETAAAREFTYPDGTLVREQSSGAVHVVFANRLYWVSTLTELSSWGGATKVRVVPNGALTNEATIVRGTGGTSVAGTICGAVVRERSRAEVFYLRYGAKFWIPDPTVLQGYGGFAAVNVVPDDALTFLSYAGVAPDSPPACPTQVLSTDTVKDSTGARIPDGTLVRENSGGAVYLVRGGALHWVSTPAELSNWGGWSAVKSLSDGTLHTPLRQTRSTVHGNFCGMVVRERSRAEVFYLRYGAKFWIPNPTVLQGYGGFAAVNVVPDGALTFLTHAGQAPATPPDCNFGLS